MKNSINILGILLLIVIVIFTNYYKEEILNKVFNNELRGVFKTNPKNVVRCVEFKTDLENLKKLISDINIYRENQLKSLNLGCSQTSTSFVNSSFDNPPNPSIVWSLYLDFKNLNRSNEGLEYFLNKFFLENIGERNVEKIILDIKGWLEDPNMDSETRNTIKKSLHFSTNKVI